MKEIYTCTLLISLFASSVFASDVNSQKTELPNELKLIYDKFVEAMKTGDAGSINQYCLPHSVSFTYEKRENTGFGPGYGHDINTCWAKNGFIDKIFSVRKDGEGCYLIRTCTTAMWFVETKSMGWKLYKYLDKPIE